jgi:hypothetical protein
MVRKPQRGRAGASSTAAKRKATQKQSNGKMQEKSMRDLLLEAGFKVPEPRGDGFIIGSGDPIRTRPRSKSGA